MLAALENIDKFYGSQDVLSGVNFAVQPGDRVALVGRNGAGKTTVLKLLSGKEEPSGGRVLLAKNLSIRVLEQDPSFIAGSTIRSVVEGAFTELDDLEASMKALEADLENPVSLDMYHELEEHYRLRGGYARNSRRDAVLHSLEFTGREDEAVTGLSGGERTRLALAQILVAQPELLLLDEPTNHLDVETLETLEEALTSYPGSLLFVTHDREFARNVATRVFGIEGGHLLEYPDGFAGYERARRGERVTLDPARLLAHELEPVVTEKPLTLAQNIQLLEERLNQLEELFLHRVGLTERDWGRLRAERSLARARLETLYALHFAAPLEFDFRVQFFKQTVLAACDESGAQWRCWVRGSQGCPSLTGQLEGGHLTLDWLEGGHALPWFTRALLEGARMIAFERIGAQRVTAPDGATTTSLEYARAVGLLRPLPATGTRKRRRRKARVAPLQAIPIAPQASSPAPEAAPKKKRRRRRKPKTAAPIAV